MIQEACECEHAHFYLLPEAYGTPVGMELMEYGCLCDVTDREADGCDTCKDFVQLEEK